MTLLILMLGACSPENAVTKQGGGDSDTSVDTGSGDTQDTDPPDTDTGPVYADNSTCNGEDNDNDGAEDAPVDLTVDVVPGNGQCVVHVSPVFSDEEIVVVETCDEGAYIACNATDASAVVAPIVGVFYPDGCATALFTNPSWDPAATTCGWLVRPGVQ